MKSPAEVLKRIDDLPGHRHLFVLPAWAEPGDLDRLIADGYLECGHQQRDQNGVIQVAMNLHLTPKARQVVDQTPSPWSRLMLRASAAGASLTALSLLVLYWG